MWGHDMNISCYFVLLGLGSWITVNGVYQELPLIAQTAPEGYDLFSYAGILVAISNIFPFLYTLAISTFTIDRENSDRICIFGFVGVLGTLVCVLLAAFWDDQSKLAGTMHSTWLLVLIFFAGGVDCMTSVLFYPMVQRYDCKHVPALVVGETLTGLIAALLATAQTDGDDYTDLRFSVTVYFLLLGVLMLASLGGFLLLEGAQLARQFKTPRSSKEDRGSTFTEATAICSSTGEAPVDTMVNPVSSDSVPQAVELDVVGSYQSAGRCAPTRSSRSDGSCSARIFPSIGRNATILLVGQAVLSFIENGALPTLLPASLKAYPNSKQLIDITTKTSFGGAIVATLLAYFHPLPAASSQLGRASWVALYAAAIGTVLWLIVLASRPVCPDSRACGGIAALVSVLAKWLVTYGKVCLFLDFHPINPKASRLGGSDSQLEAAIIANDSGARADDNDDFRFGGVGIQIGTVVGAVLFFLLNVTFKVFG